MTTMSDNTEECIARIQAAGLNGNSEIQINLDQIYTCSWVNVPIFSEIRYCYINHETGRSIDSPSSIFSSDSRIMIISSWPIVTTK